MSFPRVSKPLIVVALVIVGGLVFVGQDAWRHRCGAQAHGISAEDLGTVLYPPDRLRENNEATELVEAVEALPAPFGPVVVGRVLEGSPSVGGAGDEQFYVASEAGVIGSEYDGSLAVVAADSGQAAWGIGMTGYGAGGGTVGDLFVTLGQPEDRTLEVAAYDVNTGDRRSCAKVGKETSSSSYFDGDFGTSTIADDISLAQIQDNTLKVRRLDPESGDTAWESEVDDSRGSIEADDGGENVIISSIGFLDSLTGGSFIRDQFNGIAALDGEDGTPSWTWPSAVPDAMVQAKVVGTDPDTSRVYALEYVATGSDDSETSLVALDADGSEAWREPMSSQFCEAALWDDAVVYSCSEEVPLRALEADTGQERWTSTTDVRFVGGIPRLGDDRSVDVGDEIRLLLANDGLLQIDLATGQVSEPVTEEEMRGFVSGVDVAGDQLVLAVRRTSGGTGIFVLDLEES